MNRALNSLLLATTFTAVALPASAQSKSSNSPNADDKTSAANVIEDVVVTARRKDESIQKVPVSITAFSADMLREKEIKQVSDLTAVAPGAVFVSSGSSTNPALTIRGQTKGYGPGFPAVITYLNDVPLPTYSSLIPTYDLASVQVLKGPQGTLFGRNTNGGAVLANTVAPSFDFNGYIEGSIGNYNAREVQGAVNVPLIDQKIALRIAGDVIKRDGIVKNLGPGHDFGDKDTQSYRVSLLVQPVEWLSNTTVGDYFHADETGPGNHIVSVAPAGARWSDWYPGLAPAFGCGTSAACDLTLAFAEAKQLGPRKQNANGDPFSEQTIWGVSNTTTADFDGFRLKNIAGYRAVNFDLLYESDGTPLQVFATPNRVGTQQYSEEFQVSGEAFADKLNYIAGVFYLKDKPWGDNDLVLDIYRSPGVPDSTLIASETYYSSNSTALFTQIGYDLGDWVEGLKLNAGVRYTWDEFSGCSTSSPYREARVGYGGCKAGNGVSGSIKSEAPSWTLGLDYQLSPDVLTYISARSGYRGAGFNSPKFSPVLAAVQNFEEEKLNDVELGLKTNWQLGDTTGRFNIAVYRGAYTDIQQNVSVPINLDGDNDPSNDPVGQTVIANGGKARIQGVEIDTVVSPISGLSFSVIAAYTDAKYTDTKLPAILQATLSSANFQYTPKWTYTLGARAELPIPETVGELVFNAELYHSDSYLGQQLEVPAYEVVNLKLDWNDILRSQIDASLYVRNVFDKDYMVAPGVANIGLGYMSAVYADPRTFGVRVGYKF